MGASGSKAPCSCLEGVLKGKPSLAPDSSPTQGRRQYGKGDVSTYEQALAIERPRAGSWNSTKAAPLPDPQSKDWASPAPRSYDETKDIGNVDFTLEIEEADAPMVRLDTDGPNRRRTDFVDEKKQRSKFEVEQLLSSPGTLPKGLAADQREKVIRTMMPTATFEMLSKVPPELLNVCSNEAQALRRKLVHGSTIVFISAGLKGKRFTLERAAELGVKAVVLDHHDSWSQELVKEGVIAKFLPVDMSKSSEEVFQQALAYIKDLGNDGITGPVDGIATFIELSVPLVARLCEALGVPGFTPQAVDAARDKHATRAALARAGLPTPRNCLLKSESDLQIAATKVGFPMVLKPVSGAASLGVKKVSSEQELRASYLEVVEELSSLVVSSGALIKGDPKSTQGVDAGNLVDLTVLVEQYLDGCEVDVDVIMSEGEWRYACVSDNGPTLEPYFNETWAVCPSLLPKEQQQALKELAVNSVKALGFSAGIFHVECKYTSTGPQLIEVNARMGGGQVRECNLLTWGVDLVEETLFISLGIPVRPSLPRTPLKPVAYCYVNAQKSGTMGSIDGIKDLCKQDGVVWAKPLAQPGSKVVGPVEGMPTWLCDLLVTKPTAKEALRYLHELEANLPVEITA